MIFCYTNRQEPDIIAIRETPLNNWWKQLQRITANTSWNLANPYREMGGRILGSRRVQDTTRRPTESTKLYSEGLIETELTIREPA